MLIVKFPKKLEPFIKNPKRINRLKGGRGGAKSRSIAEAFLLWGLQSSNRFLCTREIQKSIKESVHQLLSDIIVARKYPYKVLNTSIITDPELVRQGKIPKSEFIFHGLQDKTAMNLKSLEGVTFAWVEESQTVSKKSLDILIPTIRKDGSKLVFSYNPESDDDAIESYFTDIENDVLDIFINFYDNPFLPDTLKIEEQRTKQKAERTGDWSDYNHIWLGKPVSRQGKIFRDYTVTDFDYSGFDNLREGLDWGFADDPFAWVKCHLDYKHKKLYIFQELYLYGHSNEQAFDMVKPRTSGITIIGDCSEPKSIAEGQNYGLYLQGAKKGPGSVEHGIKFLQSLEIVIHPDCVNTIAEFKKYCYKEDKNGNVLPQPIDKYNHIIDALRYALENDSFGISSSGLIC